LKNQPHQHDRGIAARHYRIVRAPEHSQSKADRLYNSMSARTFRHGIEPKIHDFVGADKSVDLQPTGRVFGHEAEPELSEK
jgi:hypothetical protein